MLGFFRKKAKDPKKELKKVLGDFELQSFPAAIANVLGMLRDPESKVSEIADQILLDPGMHVKVLRLVNSVGFGLTRKVSNLHHAVTLMGRARLESMVLTFAVTDHLPTAAVGCLDMSRFWLVAARRACLARTLALHLHAATQAECFTAGLLQDLALPVLAVAKKEEYCRLLEQWINDPEMDLAVIEQEMFGYSHAEIGAMIVQDWGLPEYLVNSIGGHHDTLDKSKAEAAIRLVSPLGYNRENDGADKVITACRDEYQIDEELILSMIEESFTEAERFAAVFH